MRAQLATHSIAAGAPTARKESDMRRMTTLHRSLVVLAVGLLTAAFPVIAMASNFGSNG